MFTENLGLLLHPAASGLDKAHLCSGFECMMLSFPNSAYLILWIRKALGSLREVCTPSELCQEVANNSYSLCYSLLVNAQISTLNL